MKSAASFRGILIVGFLTAAIVGGGVLAKREAPQEIVAGEKVVPIGSTVMLCPEPGAGAELGVRVTAAVVPGQVGQDGPVGSAAIETLLGKKSESAEITAPGGQAEIAAFGRALPPISVRGVGSLAPGLIADQWSRDPRGQGRGMASTACGPAATEFWFVGGGAIAGRQTRVVLVNPDENSAIVDIIIHGPDGIIEAPAGRGLVVKGERRVVVRLDALVPGTKATAVHVIVRTGRIGATVDDDQMSGLQSIGSDWIPSAAMPATTVYVPGVLPGNGPRVLSVVAPGDDDANVKVRVMSAAGTFAPADRDLIRVSAGTVASIDMSLVTEKQPVTLELTSDTPIVAGVRQFIGGNKAQQDTTYSSGTLPVTGTSAVSGLPVREATTVNLMVTAVTEDAVVDVTLLPFRAGEVVSTPTKPRRVKIAAGNVQWLAVDPPAGIEWFTAIVTPVEGSGPVLVAHQVREVSKYGDLVTGYPWLPLRDTVTVPVAQEDLGLTIR